MMTEKTQGELSDNSCETHKENSHGSKYMVLVDLCTCGGLRYFGPESLETSSPPVGAVWIVAGTVHTSRHSGAPCFRESD
jgi:hypothetical protein